MSWINVSSKKSFYRLINIFPTILLNSCYSALKFWTERTCVADVFVLKRGLRTVQPFCLYIYQCICVYVYMPKQNKNCKNNNKRSKIYCTSLWKLLVFVLFCDNNQQQQRCRAKFYYGAPPAVHTSVCVSEWERVSVSCVCVNALSVFVSA